MLVSKLTADIWLKYYCYRVNKTQPTNQLFLALYIYFHKSIRNLFVIIYCDSFNVKCNEEQNDFLNSLV